MRVQLEVDESRVDEWDAYVESHEEVSSRSDLIRLGVERYISDSGESDVPEEVKTMFQDIVEQHEREFDELRQTRQDVRDLRSENITPEQMSMILSEQINDVQDSIRTIIEELRGVQAGVMESLGLDFDSISPSTGGIDSSPEEEGGQ